MFYEIKEILHTVFITLQLFLAAAFLVLCIYCAFYYCQYKLDNSECIVYVNKQIVYIGRTSFVKIDPIGQYSNTKHVKIYKDKFHLKPAVHYVSNNVEVR